MFYCIYLELQICRGVKLSIAGALSVMKKLWGGEGGRERERERERERGRERTYSNGCITWLEVLCFSTFSIQVPQEHVLSRSGSQPNGRSNGAADQLSDIFDFSKVPDIDAVTRKHMGSKCAETQYS